MATSKTVKDSKHEDRWEEEKPPKDHCPPEDERPKEPKPSRRKRRRVRFDPCSTPPASPYLVIRSFGEDLGIRPIPPADAAGLAYSPDIPFVPEETPDGSIILQCWVTNIGLGPAAPVQVEFFLLPPSITSPGPAPVLVATEHTIISPHMSKLVRTRPLSFPNPFGGGLAQGVLVRCSTPFDRHSGTLDPIQDRHVAVMNAWPIIDQAPDVPLGLSNLTSRLATARIDILAHKIRLRATAPTTPPVRSHFVGQDLLEVGERPMRVANHVGDATGLKSRHQNAFRRVLNGLRTAPTSTASVQPTVGANQLAIEAIIEDAPRKYFPMADFIRQKPAAGHICDLPTGRRTLANDISLGAFEERLIRVKIAPTEPLHDDEYLAVHFFHIDKTENSFRGRVCLVVGGDLPGS